MVQYQNKSSTAGKYFLLTGLILLIIGLINGILGAFQYVIPGLFKSSLSFEKIRPLHVSSVVFWIIVSATGGVLSYVENYTGRKLFSPTLARLQLTIFICSIFFILVSYLSGIFGGREYWEYPPVLSLPIICGWLLFLINFIVSIKFSKRQPVYVWMWFTGIVFFLFSFLESYLWIFPYFRSNIVNDMTIQWKSYGSMVGSWNMLIYGCVLFLIEKISGDDNYSKSKVSFALYFLGLINLLFNWGHHIYTLPTHHFIKTISYIVSMSELLILARIIYNWKSSITTAQKLSFLPSYKLIIAADVWILLNLLLAIAMSVPAINIYTHGTHITVAHTMGATIGINTMLLLAVAYDILCDQHQSIFQRRAFNVAYWIANVSLLLFWISLIRIGVLKAKWQMSLKQIPFSVMMKQITPYFLIFLICGLTMAIGLIFLIVPLFRSMRKQN
ncbi:MAG: cbb3-type cytochrome c oxidase subunit I [Bacteroidetes bacterium]|nr:cbb3-type cytochrome c oxidase subunit I [Bacteroidota bacterium]